MSNRVPAEQPEQVSVDEKKRGITRKESTAILLASLVAAVSAFAATVIAQRSLSAEQNTEFLLFWSLLFGLFGVIAGIQQETTRAVGAARLQGAASGQQGARVVPVALLLGTCIALGAVVTSPEWAPDQIPSHVGLGVALIAVGAVLYSAHSAMSGAAAGREKWYIFAILGGGEAAWRLVAMLLAAVLVGSLVGLEAAVVSASLLWVVLLLASSQVRQVAGSRADVGAGRLTRNILFAMGSSAASAVLTVAFPTLLNWSLEEQSTSVETAALGFLILAISLTRSPIMIPLQAFQGVAISAFLKQRHRPVAAMAKPAGALLAVGALGAVAAWLIGPWLFSLIYERKDDAAAAYDMVNQGWVLGGLTFASAIMALLVLSGTAVIALNAHKVYITGWLVGAAVTTGLLFVVPFELVPRAMVALYVGPLLGFLTHLAGMVAVVRTEKFAD